MNVVTLPLLTTVLRRQAVALLGVTALAAAVLLVPGKAAAADGAAAYNQHCLVCHGADLKGVTNLGVELAGSKFVAAKSVDELTEFLKVGRMPGDPETVSNGAMPGFAWVAEDELRGIAEYLKAQ